MGRGETEEFVYFIDDVATITVIRFVARYNNNTVFRKYLPKCFKYLVNVETKRRTNTGSRGASSTRINIFSCNSLLLLDTPLIVTSK